MDVIKHLESLPNKRPDHVAELRDELMRVVRDEVHVDMDLADRIAPLTKLIGGMGEHAAECDALFMDEAQPQRVRERALSAIFHSPLGERRFCEMDALARIRFCGPWVRPMLRLGASEEFPRIALAALYRATPADARDALVLTLSVYASVLGASRVAFSELLRHGAITDAQRMMLTNAGEVAAC